jgi:hypothetical protein
MSSNYRSKLYKKVGTVEELWGRFMSNNYRCCIDGKIIVINCHQGIVHYWKKYCYVIIIEITIGKL